MKRYFLDMVAVVPPPIAKRNNYGCIPLKRRTGLKLLDAVIPTETNINETSRVISYRIKRRRISVGRYGGSQGFLLRRVSRDVHIESGEQEELRKKE